MKNPIKKRHVNFIFILISFLLLYFTDLSLIASADSHYWEYIALNLSTDKPLKSVFLDKNSYQDLGNGVYRVITKWLYHLKDPQSNTEANYQIDLSEFNCNSKTINLLSIASYNKTNSALEDLHPEQSLPIEVSEGSIDEQILEFVCQKPIENKALEACKKEKENYLQAKIFLQKKTISIRDFDSKEEFLKECFLENGVSNLNLIDSLK